MYIYGPLQVFFLSFFDLFQYNQDSDRNETHRYKTEEVLHSLYVVSGFDIFSLILFI